ncbi:hypothetical protein OE88DRAFT_241041 [Heliocybe sulcata]|uniref:Uncharacterized protein n=1 Tax=Heliocybe sulcata TaxID=5364 RepID=A0A5C3N2L2_9AGAM|nr:hypothetical protein OE88DRAFT_241041 [Heliocybe sulcata]
MEEAECEIANLRREVARMTMRSRPSSPLGTNPLPPPPKPYNDDILPNLIDKGKGIDRQLHPQNSRDTETPRHPKGSDGRSGVQSATIEPLYVSRAPSDDWETWYPLYRDSHLSADSQDRTERVQSNGQNRRSLSVIPGAHHAQRVVPPVVGRAKERETEKGSPEGPSETMVLPSLRPMGWSAETLAAAGISTDDASTSRVDALPASNIPADDDRTPYLSSQSFTDLLNRPAAATEQDLHHGDSETDHLRTLLGLPQTVMQFNASRESQGHPSSLRPGSAVPGASWSATPAVANTAQVSQSTLGSLGLAGFNNPSGSTLHSSTNLHSGLGLQIGGAGYAIARPSVVHAEDDALDQSSSEDDDDGDHDFVTPRASSGNALLFSVDAAHRSSSRLRSYSMGRHDSGAVTDVEEARANTRSAMRPSHGRSVSQQLPLVGPSSSENSLISQRNGSSVIRMTPSHPPFSGHRPASGRRTLAPDPPPPTVSFIPPIHHSRGLGSSNTSVTNFPQDPSASSSNRTMLFNISSTGTLATQQGTSRPQREIVTAHPRSSSRHEYSEHWMSASSLSSRNAETTARQR